jgi:hypothetical protein
MLSPFGIVLGTAFISMLIGAWVIYKHWDVIGGFLQKTINMTDPSSTTRSIQWFQVIISNAVVWPTWLILSIMDNIQNTVNDPFTMVDFPAGVWTMYGLANGIPAVNSFVKAFAEQRKGSEQNKDGKE